MTAPDQVRSRAASGHYLGGLEGIRGLACLGVIAAHSWMHWAPETTPGGLAQSMALGLVLFFAMSGLLISLPFVRDVARGERRTDVRRFALRRVARVFPGYVVIFLLSSFVLRSVYVGNAVVVGREGSDAGAGMMTDPGDLLANLTLVHTLLPATVQTGINPSWSLTAELCFYALLPLLLVPLVRWGGGFRTRAFWLAAAPALGFLVVGLAGRAVAETWWRHTAGMDAITAEFGPNGIAVLTLSFLGIADNFGWGMLVAVVFVWMEQGRLAWLTRRRILVGGAPVIAVAGALTLWAADHHPWFVTAAMGLAAAVMLLVLVEPTARRTPSAIVRLFGVRALEHIGMISLSAYLWHYPVLLLVSRVDRHVGLVGGDDALTMLWAPLLVATGSIALGTLTYRFVEKPAMEWAGRR
jgi:peptidoglycan/LPS O-acetylase OafA/YrhL